MYNITTYFNVNCYYEIPQHKYSLEVKEKNR